MRSKFFSPRSLLWPSLVAVVFASFFVVTQPGEIYADAYEYDVIARSILHGRFELREEFSTVVEPTMHREPGYPAFRALVYAVIGDHSSVILWLQALLCGLTVWLVGLTVRRIDPRWATPVAWLTTLYPGFTVWAGQHYSEILAAFLVSVLAYAWTRFWEWRDDARRGWQMALAVGAAIGVLTLTKASFQILPIFAVALLLMIGPWRKHWKQALLILIGFLIVVTPWMVRNQRQFGQFTITYRTGIVIYTRALNAEASWGQLATSYGSVLFGQATMLRLFPSTPPITVQLWQTTWTDKNTMLKQGMRYYQADQALLKQGVHKIFASPAVFTRYALWSGINELRFFALTSPLSPKFGVELIANQEAKEGRLGIVTLGIVLVAHALQYLWWYLIAAGLIVLIRGRFWGHPAVLLVGYAAIMYAPFDNIPRYAVPILPWIMALIVAAIIRPRKDPRILVLTESLDPTSGWGAYSRAIIRSLKSHGETVAVLTADRSSEGPRLPGVNDGRWAWLLMRVRLQYWIAVRNFEVIHVMVEPYARLSAAFGTVPFCVTVHGTYGDPAAHGPAWAVAAFRKALTNACRIVAVSDYTKQRLAQDVHSKVIVIPNGVDPSIADEPFEAAPSHGAPLILSVGALKTRKGFDRLIAGFAEYLKLHPDAELVILGRSDDPSLHARLVEQARSLGVQAHVRLLGEVSRPALLGWYRACNVFALTPVSDGGFEGFGLVYLEANVFGKPSVGSRHSGAEDAIHEGESGMLAIADDPQDVARALQAASKISTERVQASVRGNLWDSRAVAYQKLYQDCRRTNG